MKIVNKSRYNDISEIDGLQEIDQTKKYWKMKIGNIKKYKEKCRIKKLKCQNCNQKLNINKLEFHHIVDRNGNQDGGKTHQKQIQQELKINGYEHKIMILCTECHQNYHNQEKQL